MPSGPVCPIVPSVFLAKIVDTDHVIGTLVSEGDPLTRAEHEYTVSPLLDTLGGLVFQLLSFIVRVEVARLKVDPVGTLGDAPLLA